MSAYKAAHRAVKAARGSAAAHRCAGVPGYPCWRAAAEWAYMHDDPAERIEMTVDSRSGAYRGMKFGRPEYYRPMCKRCHTAWDLLPRGGPGCDGVFSES